MESLVAFALKLRIVLLMSQVLDKTVPNAHEELKEIYDTIQNLPVTEETNVIWMAWDTMHRQIVAHPHDHQHIHGAMQHFLSQIKMPT